MGRKLLLAPIAGVSFATALCLAGHAGAVAGQPCYNYPLFIFGQGSGGEQYACLDQGTNTTGLWVNSVPVIGVRQIGSQCASEQQYAAQSPDGQPLVCDIRTGWVPGP